MAANTVRKQGVSSAYVSTSDILYASNDEHEFRGSAWSRDVASSCSPRISAGNLQRLSVSSPARLQVHELLALRLPKAVMPELDVNAYDDSGPRPPVGIAAAHLLQAGFPCITLLPTGNVKSAGL